MILVNLAIGFAGGLAVAVVGVPILLWVLINYLNEEFEALVSAIEKTANTAPRQVGSPGWLGATSAVPSDRHFSSSASDWPDPLVSGRHQPPASGYRSDSGLGKRSYVGPASPNIYDARPYGARPDDDPYRHDIY